MTKSYLNFKTRINVLTGGILIIWALFIFKLSEIQIINATDNTQGLREEKIEGNRGNIFDINNVSITQNLTFYQIIENATTCRRCAARRPRKCMDRTRQSRSRRHLPMKLALLSPRRCRIRGRARDATAAGRSSHARLRER